MTEAPTQPPLADQSPLPRVMDRVEAEEIERLVKRIPARDPVHKLAVFLRQGLTPPPELVVKTLKTLEKPSSRNWRQRAVAAWALGQTPLAPDQREIAAGWLEHVIVRYHRLDQEGRLARAYLRVLTFFVTVGLGIAVFGSEGLEPLLVTPFASLPLSILFYPFSARIDRQRVNRVRAAAASAAGRLGVAHTVMVLAPAAAERPRNVRHAAAEALKSVLPVLHEGWYGHIPADTVEWLIRLLHHEDDALVIAVLRALGQVAGGGAVQAVERAAQRGRTGEIRREAEAALPALRRRQEQERQAETLLRPAAVLPQPDILLRPAQNLGESDAAVLLRPGGSGDESSE
jgi:hypothetical protein